MCLTKDPEDNRAAFLGCEYIRPEPIPAPQRSWYKDGELVYSISSDIHPNALEFLAANPLLDAGDLTSLRTYSSGSLYLIGYGFVEDSTSPSSLPPNTGVLPLKRLMSRSWPSC